MNVILFFADELDGDRVSFIDQRAEHITRVLRSKPGDTLRIGLVNGPLGIGTVETSDQKAVTLRVALHGPMPVIPPTALILAVPRPIMLKRVLAQATAMGVARIFLIKANRVEKSFFNASLLHDEAYRSALVQGLEQAIDTRLPEVSIHGRFRPFIEDVLPPLLGDYPVRLVAHPGAAQTLPAAVPPPLTRPALLAIGPEGGWVDFEITKFIEQGFLPFSLGPRILRVDSAVPALLAQLDLLRTLPARTPS